MFIYIRIKHNFRILKKELSVDYICLLFLNYILLIKSISFFQLFMFYWGINKLVVFKWFWFNLVYLSIFFLIDKKKCVCSCCHGYGSSWILAQIAFFIDRNISIFRQLFCTDFNFDDYWNIYSLKYNIKLVR